MRYGSVEVSREVVQHVIRCWYALLHPLWVSSFKQTLFLPRFSF